MKQKDKLSLHQVSIRPFFHAPLQMKLEFKKNLKVDMAKVWTWGIGFRGNPLIHSATLRLVTLLTSNLPFLQLIVSPPSP